MYWVPVTLLDSDEFRGIFPLGGRELGKATGKSKDALSDVEQRAIKLGWYKIRRVG